MLTPVGLGKIESFAADFFKSDGASVFSINVKN